MEGVPPTRQTQLHLDRCLTCRNCESTCPSGVQYGHLVDIGRNIRQIILGDLASDSFSRLIFFSLPYLKHNRLTLPPVGDTRFADLQSCLRILYASCLGMLQPRSKKPPWGIRVQLHVFTHQLLINATHKDLHTFFKHHLALLRISLIESVIFFMREKSMN
jgi:ferredoxin